MSRITNFIVERKELILIGTFIALAISSIGLQTLEFSSGSSEDALPDDLQAVQTQKTIKRDFESGETVIVSVQVDDLSKGTVSVLDPEVVKATHRFSQSVKKNDFVIETSSYASAIYEALDRPPSTRKEVKQIINQSPRIRKLISDSQSTTVINVNIESESGLTQLGRVIDDIDQSINNAGFPAGIKATQTGTTAISYRVSKMVQSDLSKMLILALILVFGALLIFYRGVARAIIPVIPLIIGVILTIGSLSLLGININPATASVGAMLIGMGIDYGIHVYNRYYEGRKEGKNPEESAKFSINGVSKAIIGTSATTAVGFASLYVSRISFMKDLGISLVLGILLTMIFSLSLLPVLIIYEEKIRKKLTGHYESIQLSIHSGRINQSLITISKLIENHHKKIIALFFLGTLFMSYGATKTKMETRMEEALPEDMDEINALTEIRNELGGKDTVSVIIEAQNGEDVRDPELLKQINVMKKLMKRNFYNTKITSVNSITDLFKDIPNDESRIKQIIRNNPRARNQYINNDYTVLRTTLTGKISGKNQIETQENLDNIKKSIQRINFPSGYKVSTGGSLALSATMRKISQEDMSLISIVGFLGILLVVLMLFRSFTDGIIMSIPMVIGATWTFGFIGFVGMEINQFLIGFFTMILGLGIDFGMHITHRYKESKSIQKTLTSVGPGILTAAATTVLGYLALLSGSLPMLHNLGIILAVGILTSMFAAFMLTPSLIKLKETYKGGKNNETK